MIIRGVKKEDYIVRGNGNSPKQCRVHAKSLIELKKHLTLINQNPQNTQNDESSNETNQVPDIKKITRQFSHTFFNSSKKGNGNSSRLKTDEGRQTFHNSTQQTVTQNQFIPFMKERDQLGRLLTENYDPEDDQTVFTYRPASQRKHAKSTDMARVKTLPNYQHSDNQNMNSLLQLRMNKLYKDKKMEDSIQKNKIEEMIDNYQVENKILLGVSKQNNYEVQPLDSYNHVQLVSYRLNINHSDDLHKKQEIANSLTYARGFYKRAQADEQYKKFKTNSSRHETNNSHIHTDNSPIQTLPNQNFHNANNNNNNQNEMTSLQIKVNNNKSYYINLRRQQSCNLNQQLQNFKKRNQEIKNNPIPPLGYYDETGSQEKDVIQSQPKAQLNKQQIIAKDKRDEEQSTLQSPQRPATNMKKQNENQNINYANSSTKKSDNQIQSLQKLKSINDSSIAQIDKINPKVFEQIKEQEERRVRIEKNIDKIALDFNSEKASTLFTQNFLKTKQKLRRIKNNLNNMEYETMTYFDQVIQNQNQKKKDKIDEGLY